MVPWIRKNLALVLILAGLAGWGIYSVGNRMLAERTAPPGYSYHCFDSGELASNCVYLADPSSQSGWVLDRNLKLEIIDYRTTRYESTQVTVLAWAGKDPPPCGFKRICFVAANGNTECLVMRVYDSACD
jgi:hypothetical protein